MHLTYPRRKYRTLDDCARLRDIVEQLHAIPQLRFTPALLVLTWAEQDGADVAPDFSDMVCDLCVCSGCVT